jgi:hypothetical protein
MDTFIDMSGYRIVFFIRLSLDHTTFKMKTGLQTALFFASVSRKIAKNDNDG